MSVFKITEKSHLEQPMFFGESVDIQRYETVKDKHVQQLADQQFERFWNPEEIDLTKDTIDFKNLPQAEEHIFTSNLKRQIMLDSIQGRSPNIALLPLVSLPEVETFVEMWSFFEVIHSKSYTHILRNAYPDPSDIFDGIKDIKEIIECADEISKYYDDLIEYNVLRDAQNNQYITLSDIDQGYSLYEHKKKLWLLLHAINALEGIRFYVSFACSWAFAENKKMVGNADIIKLICRDENLHLGFTQYLIKNLPKSDSDFDKLSTECYDECKSIMQTAIKQEKDWAEYLFRDGSMIGLNKEILIEYIEWIGAKRMRAIKIESDYQIGSTNPLPWTIKWIEGDTVQKAPQEVDVTSYVRGGIDNDVSETTFKGFEI